MHRIIPFPWALTFKHKNKRPTEWRFPTLHISEEFSCREGNPLRSEVGAVPGNGFLLLSVGTNVRQAGCLG